MKLHFKLNNLERGEYYDPSKVFPVICTHSIYRGSYWHDFWMKVGPDMYQELFKKL